MPVWRGARCCRVAIMVALAFAIERLVLRPLVNQDGIILFMATIGLTFFLEGFGQTLWGSDIYTLDLGMPEGRRSSCSRACFPGGLLVEPARRWSPRSSRPCWSRCWRSSSRRRGSAARCAPSPTTTRRRCRSASRSTRSG